MDRFGINDMSRAGLKLARNMARTYSENPKVHAIITGGLWRAVAPTSTRTWRSAFSGICRRPTGIGRMLFAEWEGRYGASARFAAAGQARTLAFQGRLSVQSITRGRRWCLRST